MPCSVMNTDTITTSASVSTRTDAGVLARNDADNCGEGVNTSEPVRLALCIAGIVQGVGFRPFVFRTAIRNRLTGNVRNESGAVIVEVEGKKSMIESFIHELRTQLPPLAKIEKFDFTVIKPLGDTEFRIIESNTREGDAALLLPDIATCPDCLREMNDPKDPRYRYPFINCTNCGPRFSIIVETPYDRCRTTMDDFELCPLCREEYSSPSDRRFHAEPVACPNCGPRLHYHNTHEVEARVCEAALEAAIRDLAAGNVVAIKGVGGYHLACNPFDEQAVRKLRLRKNRPNRPFAVMFRDLSEIRCYCDISPTEETHISSFRRPILLLEKLTGDCHNHAGLAPSISPALNTVGAFLPYAPLHHLLLNDPRLSALVMTSGNRSEEPIVTEHETAGTKLYSIADSFLHHNRRIWNRNDDSVGYVYDNKLILTRRSRGFAPLPVGLSKPVRPTLALGAMYANTFTLAAGNRVYISQHIGDVENRETLEFLNETINKFKRWLKIEPEVIVCDLHPDLITSRLAEEIAGNLPLRRIQHHHAHFASLLAANHIDCPAIGLVCDGTGYGEDGTIWGGEILYDDAKSISRCGHLALMPLAGGDATIRHPWRTAVAYASSALPDFDFSHLPAWDKLPSDEIAIVRQMISRQFNVVSTSSAGRLFDAISALLGICFNSTYEGQAAIELEHCAARFRKTHSQIKCLAINFELCQHDNNLVIEVAPAIRGIIQSIIAGDEAGKIASNFHTAFAEVLAGAAIKAARYRDVDLVGLCGGVFQNRLLLEDVARRIALTGLRPIIPCEVPINDAGISLGQIALSQRADIQSLA